LLGIYFLNISVDTVDLNPEYIPEDLSINDQESIIEIIVEQILGYENAFEEYDDNDTEEHNKTNLKIELTEEHLLDYSMNHTLINTAKQKFSDYTNYLQSGFDRLEIPPPKA